MALVFRRAAQILQARGHGKGMYEWPTGEVCAVGALLAAEDRKPSLGVDPFGDVPETVRILSDRLWVPIDDKDPVERVAEWNDAPSRTQAEVVAELLSAARDIEARDRDALLPTEVRLSSEQVAA
jgi:hypothetical protein